MIYLTNLNLNGNELQNAVVQPLAVAPANPKLGQIYCNSATSKIMYYDGSKWATVGVVVEASEVNGKIRVDGVEMTVYTLPTASATTLGGVKVGAGFSITEEGVLVRNLTYFVGTRANVEGVPETDNQVFARVLNGVTPVEGDFFVIKTLINGDKYSFASFVFDNGVWNAMDGNVDATNVIMRSDIVTAGDYTQVGNVTKGRTATGAISAAGKSIADVLQSIFTKELNPSKTDPAVTISDLQTGAHEVGTTLTPKWKAALSAGSYTYGPETGITAKSWAISDTEGNTSAEAAGTFPQIIVGDTTSYKITAVATHEAGSIPLTNLKNEYAAEQIPAGTKSLTSGAITGYRKFFYGSKTAAVSLTSENIRGLTNSNKAVGTSQTFDVAVVEGATQIIVAFPTSTGKSLSKVLDANAFGTDIVGSFVKSTVKVEGANAYTAVDYDVYVYTPDAALSANTYTVTIA